MSDPEQARQAIRKAQRTRSERAALIAHCRELGYYESARHMANVLTEGPPSFTATMLAWDLLRLTWRGTAGGVKRQHRIKHMLQEAQIDPWTTVGDLTERQRLALADELRRAVGRSCTHDSRAAGRTRLASGLRIHEIVCEDCGAVLRVLDTTPYHPERMETWPSTA